MTSNLSHLNLNIENNLLVEGFKIHEGVAGVIDFGDAIYAPRISELAIACAYAGMHCEDPIQAMKDVVRGFHDQVPIEDEELSILFPMIMKVQYFSHLVAKYY